MKWLWGTIGVVSAVAGLVLVAFQFPALRPWVQIIATIGTMAGLYWYAWTGHGDTIRYPGNWHLPAPFWLSLLCGKPRERLNVVMVWVQVGVIGYAIGAVVGFVRDPENAHEIVVSGWIGGILPAIGAMILWALWGAWRWVNREDKWE